MGRLLLPLPSWDRPRSEEGCGEGDVCICVYLLAGKPSACERSRDARAPRKFQCTLEIRFGESQSHLGSDVTFCDKL